MTPCGRKGRRESSVNFRCEHLTNPGQMITSANPGLILGRSLSFLLSRGWAEDALTTEPASLKHRKFTYMYVTVAISEIEHVKTVTINMTWMFAHAQKSEGTFSSSSKINQEILFYAQSSNTCLNKSFKMHLCSCTTLCTCMSARRSSRSLAASVVVVMGEIPASGRVLANL